MRWDASFEVGAHPPNRREGGANTDPRYRSLKGKSHFDVMVVTA